MVHATTAFVGAQDVDAVAILSLVLNFFSGASTALRCTLPWFDLPPKIRGSPILLFMGTTSRWSGTAQTEPFERENLMCNQRMCCCFSRLTGPHRLQALRAGSGADPSQMRSLSITNINQMATPGFEFCSLHLCCWGQNTSWIQHKRSLTPIVWLLFFFFC